MVDPLGTVASVLAVLKLAVGATEYIKNVKQGSSDRLRLRDELRSAICLLEMLKDRIDDSEDAVEGDEETLKPLTIASLVGEDGPLALFKRILEDIIAKLAPQDRLRRLAQPFKWPFDKKDVTELVSALERLKSHFNLVMQNDLVELAKLSHLKLESIHQEVTNATSKSMDNESQKIIHWVSPLAYRPTHLDILESAQPGTGTWFLDSLIFKRWAQGEIDVLWCPGIPGAGKTILASLVIDKLERENVSAGIICTYVYCRYNKRAEQTPVTLISSILQQILQHSTASAVPAEVVSLYQIHKKHGTRPTLTQVTDTLRALTANFTTFHVVVDALDECAGSDDDALRLISTIRSIGPCIKLLCTSRFSTVFGSYFGTATKLEISAQSEDIRLFLDSQIQQQSSLARHVRADSSLKDEIIDAIVRESHGMFLLAKLHLESLSKKINRKAVRAALKTLPATLDATYSDAVERIYNQAPDLVEVAQSVLFWIICAKRPLSVLELRHVYATLELPEGTALEDDDLPDGEVLTSTCGGLILVDGESQTVRLVHYTTQEYFERSHIQSLAAARLSLSNICLSYLVLPNFSDGPCLTDQAMSWRLRQYPFLDYASKYWGEDIGRLSNAEADTLWPKLESFLVNRTALDVANQVQNLPRLRYSYWSQEYPRDIPPLVLAAEFDMPKIIRRLITVQSYDLESHGSDRVTALIRAAARGLAGNVQVLLELGAQKEARDYLEETALHKAGKKGAEDAVKVLIAAGADINARSPDWTTLMTAVSGGNIEVAKILIHAGADYAAENAWGESALTVALRSGQEAIATLLFDHGAVLPRNPAGRRASMIASRKGIQQLVSRLTADYEAVAARRLQRQTSGVVAGLSEIQEQAEDPDATSSNTASNTLPGVSDADEDGFLSTLEHLSYHVGFRKTFEVGRKIGIGHFADVYECYNRVTSVRAAVKIYKFEDWGRATQKRWTLQNEVAFLQRFREDSHHGILKMMNVFVHYKNQRVFVVTELAGGGDLFDLIVKKVCLSEEEARRVFEQLFSAVGFLHDRGWIHRDIKPENILLSDQKSLTIKLADFGYATQAPANSGLWHYGVMLCGTVSYISPEVLQPESARKLGTPTDIWSCGVVLYICLCGFPPFSEALTTVNFPYSLDEQIKAGIFDYPSPYWASVSDAALSLIDDMIVVDMAKRLTAKQCLEHLWMNRATPTTTGRGRRCQVRKSGAG